MHITVHEKTLKFILYFTKFRNITKQKYIVYKTTFLFAVINHSLIILISPFTIIKKCIRISKNKQYWHWKEVSL